MIPELRETAISSSYIVATLLFILGLKKLSSPKTARAGNRLVAVGMFLALAATLFDRQIISFTTIAIGGVLGAIAGIVGARRVKMTAMPQMVALFNGAGGGTAALVSVAEFLRASNEGSVSVTAVVSIVLGTLIGSVSLSGSLVAFGKLQELLPGRPLQFPGQRLFNLALVVALVWLGALLVMGGQSNLLWWLFAGSLLLGVMATLPIGGGDMPVVIAVLNSLTGLATAITGLELNNEMLIVAGMLVGASGTLLTLLMSKAMNRSLGNVLFGAFGAAAPAGAVGAGAGAENLIVRETSPDDLAVALAYARRVVVVPGYGMAVAQAQHDMHAVENELASRGVDVKYAIHPVAGRMPGHMNVLLAEANVPYDRLLEMDVVNGMFDATDVALIVGANDVVNPAAREDRTSPIYGMPILDADRAKLVVVLKRGMSAGFAGIDNPLFYKENTRMLFGDAKKSLARVAEAIKTV